MPDVNARDAKLIQYLSEAHLKERQLEQALEAHIAMTEVASYRKRLRQHLTETKNHARQVERRMKQLGGRGVVQEVTTRAQEVAGKGAALAQGPVHMLRGTSEPEKMLRNARTEFQNEAEEIAHYSAIEALAKVVGDRETEQLAKSILREEKRMAGFLEKLIPRLTQAVARKEIPAAERNGGRRRTTRRATSRSRSTTRSRSGTSRSRSGSSRSSGRTTARSSGSRRSTGTRRSTSRRTTARSRARATSGSGSSSRS